MQSIARWGNSLALRIPKSVAEVCDLKAGSGVYQPILKEPLATVAAALGYASQSVFITMFRKSMGTTRRNAIWPVCPAAAD